MTQKRKYSLQIFSLILFLAFGFACTKQQNEPAESKTKVSKEAASIVDSPEERHAQALMLIEKYPMGEWETDILGRISSIAGKEVSEEVRSRAQKRLSEKDLLEKRISLLTEIFTAAELAQLANLYSSAQGKDLLRKVSKYDEHLRDLISPLVMEVLSNQSN